MRKSMLVNNSRIETALIKKNGFFLYFRQFAVWRLVGVVRQIPAIIFRGKHRNTSTNVFYFDSYMCVCMYAIDEL